MTRRQLLSGRLRSGIALVLGAASLEATAVDWHPPDDIATTARLAAASQAGVEFAAARLAPGYDVAQLRLPRCPNALTTRGGKAPWLQARLSIEVQCPSPYWRVFVPVALEARRDVVVLARATAAGSVLGPADLVVANRELAGLSGDSFRDPRELVGTTLLRNAGGGQPILAGWVRRRPPVRRGEPVTIVARSQTLNVRADGVAASDAQLSERVRVRNRTSGREVDGIVRGDDLVEVTLD